MGYVSRAGFRVYERRDWGAQPPQGRYTRTDVTQVGVHHGGPTPAKPPRTKSGVGAILRSYQRFHLGIGMVDIAYNFAVGGGGAVFLCRPFGAMPAQVAIPGHPEWTFNDNSAAILFPWNCDVAEIPRAARATFTRLWNKGLPEEGLRPLAFYAHHSGADWFVRGHNEYPGHRSNTCPGRFGLALLRELRD
jgi:hypothetical protein